MSAKEVYLSPDRLKAAREAIAANDTPECKIALACIDRMIPQAVYEERDSRIFQSLHSDYVEYQCPLCHYPLEASEDEMASDVIFYCPYCGQAVEWE